MRISKASSWYNYVKRKSLQDLLNYIKLYSAFLKCCCKIYFMINSATCIFNKVKFYSLIWIFCKSKRTAGSYYSSFRRPTLLDSPIPIFEFRGRGGWPKKFRGGKKLHFYQFSCFSYFLNMFYSIWTKKIHFVIEYNAIFCLP